MPLNPNIALQVRGLDVPNPLAQMAQVTQIQNALQQQRMGDIQMQNALREQQRAQGLERLMAGFAPDAKTEDITSAMQRGGYFKEAQTFVKSRAELEKERRQAAAAQRQEEEARLKGLVSQADIVGRVLGAVKDQASFDFAVKKLAEQRIFTPDDVTFLGATYDPARVQQVLDTTLSQRDRLEVELKKRTTAAAETSAQAGLRRATAAEAQAMTARDRATWERNNPGYEIRETEDGYVKVNKRTGVATPLTMASTSGVEPVQLRGATKGSRPQLLQLQDELRLLVSRGQGDSPEAKQIRDQIRTMTSKGAPELPPRELQMREAKLPAARQAIAAFDAKTDKLSAQIQELMDHPGLNQITGLIGGRIIGITDEGRRAEALYNSIIAQGGFSELQALRDASTTGGALGNVSNREGEQLRDAFGVLKRTQSTEDLKRGLKDVLRTLSSAKLRTREAFDDTYAYRETQSDRASQRSATPRGPAPSDGRAFNTVQEAEAANLPPGTRITIGGRPAVVE